MKSFFLTQKIIDKKWS